MESYLGEPLKSLTFSLPLIEISLFNRMFLPYQSPVILIHARSNTLKDLELLMPAVQKLLSTKLTEGIYHVGV
jgi:hypothetical protein